MIDIWKGSSGLDGTEYHTIDSYDAGISLSIKPFSMLIELENDAENNLQLAEGTTMISYLMHRIKMNYEMVLYTYMGKGDTPENQKAVFKLAHQKVPECVKQFNTMFLAVSTLDGVEIFNAVTKQALRKLDFNKPYQLLLRVNSKPPKVNQGAIDRGEICIGYSYKNLFCIGLSLNQDLNLQNQTKLLHIGDICYATQVESRVNGKYTNTILYSLREDDGIIRKLHLKLL